MRGTFYNESKRKSVLTVEDGLEKALRRADRSDEVPPAKNMLDTHAQFEGNNSFEKMNDNVDVDGDETSIRRRLKASVDIPREFVERQARSRRKQRIRHRWCSKLRLQRNLLTGSVLKSFIENISVAVLLQIALAVICTVICDILDLELNAQMTLFVSPIVFPLSFSINACYQRREKVLDDLANLKAAAMVLFFCHRDWWKQAGLPKSFISDSLHTMGHLMDCIRSYLLTNHNIKRIPYLGRIYLCMSEIAQLNDKVRASKELPMNGPLVTRLIHYNNIMCWSFERLRVVREYRSPRTIRAFTKVLIFVLPLLLSPYYVYVGRSSTVNTTTGTAKLAEPVTAASPTPMMQQSETRGGTVWPAYFLAVLVSFVFGSLQAVEDALDDPFDGISEDDINLDQLQDWACFTYIVSPEKTVPSDALESNTEQKRRRENSPVYDSDADLSDAENLDDATAVEIALAEIASRAKGGGEDYPMMLSEEGGLDDAVLLSSPVDQPPFPSFGSIQDDVDRLSFNKQPVNGDESRRVESGPVTYVAPGVKQTDI
ncbi:uncharacterized protein [Oscarella lobularis]|uniref:uncharacterized protein isoform X2 n=1 Tax=Oscarella lobularis TaxID=121494 RepID=UPI00331327AA